MKRGAVNPPKSHWKRTLIPPDAAIGDAVIAINDGGYEIGLVAGGDGRLLGTVTDGDVRRGLLRGLDMSAAITEIMNAKPLTAAPETVPDALLTKMTDAVVRQIPLVDDGGRVVGLVHMRELTPPVVARDNWVVLMAGGRGERLRPLTKETPKPLLNVGDKPLLQSILESFVEQKFRRFYISVNYRADALGGDSRSPPLVSRCMSWGDANDRWLDSIEARLPRVRTGSPLSDRYRATTPQPETPPRKQPEDTNVLVLQYAPIYSDPKGLNVNMYGHFVDVVRLLRDRGYRNIWLKLHPGPGRWKKSYFEDIAGFFGLGCPVLKTEPFDQCVAWADMVIGPAQTGALFETLAAGKPYYTFMMPPHTLDPGFYGNYRLFSTVEEFAAALGGPHPKGGRRLLNAFYNVDDNPSGCKRIWEVLERDLGDIPIAGNRGRFRNLSREHR